MNLLLPIDCFSLAFLFQIKLIHKNLQNQNQSHFNYTILQSLLILSSHLIFNRHQFQFHHINDIYQLIYQKLIHIQKPILNQIINEINLSLKFAFNGSADGLYQFINQLNSLISPSSPSELDRPTNFHPDSPIGLYLRSCRIHIVTLEFDQLSIIATNLKSFFNPTNEKSSSILPQSSSSYPHLNNKSTIDAFLDFTDTYAPDYNKASNSLRRFYDLRSSNHKINNSNNHTKSSNQTGSNHLQALLSLSKFYFSVEAYPTALDALHEAARSARLVGDRNTLDRCACLERRIKYFGGFETNLEKNSTDGTEEEGVGTTGPIQAQSRLQSLRNLGHSNHDNNDQKSNQRNQKLDHNTTSGEWHFWDHNEEIFSVFKSIFVGAEPINHLHARLFRANRMQINNNNNLENAKESGSGVQSSQPFDQVSWFALQAKIWDLQGQVGLCEIYEDLALDYDDEEIDYQFDNFELISKSDVICHRSLRMAKNGQFYEALLLICQLIISNQSTAKSFKFIHKTVYDIFKFKANYDQNQNLMSYFEMFHPDFSSQSQLYEKNKINSVQNRIEKSIKQAESSMNCGNHHAALCPIVTSITQSDKMNLKVNQSKGIILWADIILHLHQDSITATATKSNRNIIFQKLGSILDLPHLHSNLLLQIDLFWILVRLDILQLFPSPPPSSDHVINLDHFVSKLDEIFDLFSIIDTLYQKVEDSKGRKKVIGYSLVIIEEIKIKLSLNFFNQNQAKDNFSNKIDQLEIDLKQKWIEICNHKDKIKNKGNNPSLIFRVNTNHGDVDTDESSLIYLFSLFKNLLSASSVHCYL